MIQIEYDLQQGRVILYANYSRVEISDAQVEAGKLTAILKLIALAEASSEVERAVANHDLQQMLRDLSQKWAEGSDWKESGCAKMRRFTERGKAAPMTLEELGL